MESNLRRLINNELHHHLLVLQTIAVDNLICSRLCAVTQATASALHAEILRQHGPAWLH